MVTQPNYTMPETAAARSLAECVKAANFSVRKFGPPSHYRRIAAALIAAGWKPPEDES